MRLRAATALFAILLLLLPALPGCAPADSEASSQQVAPFALAIHGGAGTITRSAMTPEREAEYRAKLEEALRAGHAVLAEGGTSLDAVVAAITLMEDSPLFNAGVGAVFTSEGTVEHDASIMDGRTRNSGAVAGTRQIRNPITLARRVMEDSPHVMMVGAGAEAFAQELGFEMVPNETFHTDRRRRSLERAREREAGTAAAMNDETDLIAPLAYKYGTVGAVALDQEGNLAAATSTGGMTNKRFGRVGDAPIIGAGTYAENETCAVSATGHGEYFIRGVVAHDIAAQMRYTDRSVDEAATDVINRKLGELGGTGGVIALDRQGNVSMPFNTEGMYRGSIDADGNVTVGIYGDE